MQAAFAASGSSLLEALNKALYAQLQIGVISSLQQGESPA